MKPSELVAAKGNEFIPDAGMVYSVTVTFSDTVEVEFTGVVKLTRMTDASEQTCYWLEMIDGTWTEIPPRYYYVQIRQIAAEDAAK